MRRSIELAITSGILLVILGLLFPFFLRSRLIEEQQSEARAGLNDIREAILSFREDTGRFPTRGADGEDRRLYRLCGPGHIASNAYFRTDLHQGWLGDHLEQNSPAPLVGRSYEGWQGPYLSPAEDPWGSAYVVVMYPASFEDARDCIAVSAGPNGVMDADYSSPYDVQASGDDLLVVIHDKSAEDSAPLF